jgi:hypothetical protein
MHELVHGLGPRSISIGGRATTVRQELKETSSAIEEARPTSQASSRCSSHRQGTVAEEMERTMYTTFWPRRPIDPLRHHRSAGNRSRATQLPLDRGAFVVNADGVRRRRDRCRGRPLARGHDAAGGGTLRPRTMLTLGIIRPPTQAVLDKLKGAGIAPRFTSAALLSACSRAHTP